METINKKQALKLLKIHGNYNFYDLKHFVIELGNCPFYKKSSVLIWLGY
jgi:hypothetical protein